VSTKKQYDPEVYDSPVEPGETFVPVYRKVRVANIPVGGGRESFEYAALMTMADVVRDEAKKVDQGTVLHDVLETQFEGHHVKLSLGDLADEA
jgi:hypothetical protein